jgi:hypothetical protein
MAGILLKAIEGIRNLSSSSRFFVPEKLLYALFSKAAILSCLNDIPQIEDYDRPIMAQTILENARKILAILIFIGREGEIVKFLYREIYDTSLPLSVGTIKSVSNRDFAAMFSEVQWEYIAPVFRRGGSHREIQPREDNTQNFILPFLEEEEIGSGAFGTVFKVSLSPYHQALLEESGESVRQYP